MQSGERNSHEAVAFGILHFALLQFTVHNAHSESKDIPSSVLSANCMGKFTRQDCGSCLKVAWFVPI